MSLIIALEELKKGDRTWTGQCPAAALALGLHDELIECQQPLRFSLTARLLEKTLLVQGNLELPLTCSCARCLAPFTYALGLSDWMVSLPMTGPEAVDNTDGVVDLTPWVREDILLAFPQHPLCSPECPGLSAVGDRKSAKSGAPAPPSAWACLNDWQRK